MCYLFYRWPIEYTNRKLSKMLSSVSENDENNFQIIDENFIFVDSMNNLVFIIINFCE